MHGEMLNMVIDQENVIPLFADIESIAPFSSNFCCHDWNTPSSVKFWSFAGELFLFSPLLRLCGSHCSEGDTICLGLGLLSFSVLDTVWIPPPPGHFSAQSQEVSTCHVVGTSLLPCLFPLSDAITWTVDFPVCFSNFLLFSHLFPLSFCSTSIKISSFSNSPLEFFTPAMMSSLKRFL